MINLERHGKCIAVSLLLLCGAPVSTTAFAMGKNYKYCTRR